MPILENERFHGAVVVFRARRQAAEIALQTSNESLLANADALFEEKARIVGQARTPQEVGRRGQPALSQAG